MNYLLDIYLFEPEDLTLNATVLLWPQNINPIFDENDEVNIHFLTILHAILSEKKIQFCKYLSFQLLSLKTAVKQIYYYRPNNSQMVCLN